MYTRRAVSMRGSISYFIQLSETLRLTASTYHPKRLPKSPEPPVKLRPPLVPPTANDPYGPLTGPPWPNGILFSSTLATSLGGGFFCVDSRGPLCFASRSGIGIAFGSSLRLSLGCDCASPFDSLARTFWVSAGGVGNGIVLTRVALIAPPPPAVPPQLSPRRLGIRYPNKARANS